MDSVIGNGRHRGDIHSEPTYIYFGSGEDSGLSWACSIPPPRDFVTLGVKNSLGSMLP
jgi:hypothetical protein